jgi:peptidoglycan/xylan/chitin deacetylase (PgdA/CDA1 family)
MNWPNGSQCAVILTFDLDAELMWYNNYPHTPGYIARGQYGPLVGAPRILALMEKYKIPSTFFIPGAVAEKYPDLTKRIHDEGHEIGHHGYLHEYVSRLEEKEEREMLQKGMDAIEKVSGSKPQGIRSPAADFSENSLALFEEFEFIYDSSMMKDDFNPYYLTDFNPDSHIVEIPFSWDLDDAPYFQFLFKPYRGGLAAPTRVFEIWSAEFDAAYEQGGVFTLCMHPQIIGRAHRMRLLEDLIQYIRGYPGVWFTTCLEAAKASRSFLK